MVEFKPFILKVPVHSKQDALLITQMAEMGLIHARGHGGFSGKNQAKAIEFLESLKKSLAAPQ